MALREEAVILAEAQIATAEDALRALVYNPTEPNVWTLRIEASNRPPFEPTTVDVEAASRMRSNVAASCSSCESGWKQPT